MFCRYTLLQDGKGVYKGKDLVAKVESLVPFKSYAFSVLACTAVGCTTSKPVSVTTGAETPAGQGPPTFTGVTPQSVVVTWKPPSQPVHLKFFDLNRAPYVLYGVKYIDLVSLDARVRPANLKFLHRAPFFCFSKWRKIWI